MKHLYELDDHMNKVFCRSAFNYDMAAASLESGLACSDPSLAQQHFKEECDINTIVERFHLTGEVPQLEQLPSFANYEGIFDFQSAMNTVRAAQETFMTLPAKLRARFNNDPQTFLEFCSNEDNRAEAKFLGLLKPEEPPIIDSAPQPTGDDTNGPKAQGSTRNTPQSQAGTGRAQGVQAETAPAQKS